MAKKLTEKQAEHLFDTRLKSLCGAALADPSVDPEAKSLAGFWLERLSAQEQEQLGREV